MATSFPALAIQNQESPLKQFGEAQAIVGQIQLQQARQNQQSQQALMRLFSQNKGDMDKTYSDAVDSGQVTPEHLNAFRNANLEAQTKAATLGKDKLELHQKLNEATANELDGIQA